MSLQFVLYTFRTYYIQLYDYKHVLSRGRFGMESFRPAAVRRSRPCARTTSSQEKCRRPFRRGGGGEVEKLKMKGDRP